MAQFDPTHAVRFDLGRGQIEREAGQPRLLVSADALAELAAAAGEEATRDFGGRLGTEMGRRVQSRLDTTLASFDAVADDLGIELALAGLGAASLERWGRALVVRLDGLAPGLELLAAATLEGALQRAFARDARAVLLEQGDTTRYLLASEGAAAHVAAWMAEGISWAEAVARLHEEAP